LFIRVLFGPQDWPTWEPWSAPYSQIGVILMAFSWALWVRSWLTLAYTLAMLVFFDIKSRLEEQWLGDKFAGFRQNQVRVSKLIPFIC
jgi:protein-S-isoprenylcysteine O-methyltransferase Ste14